MSNTIFAQSKNFAVGPKRLEQLRFLAQQSPLRRARICLHQDHSDPIQEMVIGIFRGSFIRPHRQTNKRKSYAMIEGQILVVFFNEQGDVDRKILMGLGNSEQVFIYSFCAGQWHMPVAVSDFAVYLETMPGPYSENETEYPPWMPSENNIVGRSDLLAKISKGGICDSEANF